MRFLFVVPRFFPYPGGYENYVFRICQKLIVDGHVVSVFTTNAFDLEFFWLKKGRSLPPGVEIVEQIEIHRFPICHARWSRRAERILGFLPNWRFHAQFRKPGFKVLGLVEALSKVKADLIHVGPLPYSRLMYHGVREAERRGTRLLCTPCTHFGESGNDDIAKHYTRPHHIAILKKCDAVLTLTEMERKRLLELGLTPEKTFFTGAGIYISSSAGGDGSAARASHGMGEAPIVLHLGTKAHDKGSMSVLDAMHILWAQGSDAWLVMAGSGVGPFEEYAATRPHPQFLNLGTVAEDEKRNLLAAASMVVQPSRVESFGMVYLEAWANKKALVVADTPASRDIVEDGEDGLLVPFADSVSLARTIADLLSTPGKRQQLGDRGYAKVSSQFDWECALERILPLFYGS